MSWKGGTNKLKILEITKFVMHTVYEKGFPLTPRATGFPVTLYML